VRRTATESLRWRGREVLSGPEAVRSQPARGDGGHWACTLVRAVTAKLGIEVWIGDAAKIKTKRVRKQKNDRQDAQLVLKLLREDRFPRIWVASPENRDLRQLLWHRHRLVQLRMRIMNQLRAAAMNEGLRRNTGLCGDHGGTQLTPWATRRARFVGVAGCTRVLVLIAREAFGFRDW
jgi:hypothetical protein